MDLRSTLFYSCTCLLLLVGCDKSEHEGLESEGRSAQELLYVAAVLDEINFARTTPSDYASSRLSQEASSGEDNGAYGELMLTVSVNPLILNEKLGQAADDYASTLSRSDSFSHYEDGSPSERCRRVGYEYYGGENIAAGSQPSLSIEEEPELAAQLFVKMLIIDEGVEGVGHRRNILSERFVALGVGAAVEQSSIYVNYTVQNFGTQ